MRKVVIVLLASLIGMMLCTGIPIADAAAGIKNIQTSFTVNCIPGSAATTISLSFDYQRGVMETQELHWEVWFKEADVGADEPMALYSGTFKSIAEGGNWIEHASVQYSFNACPWIDDDPGDCIEVYATIDVDGHEIGVIHHLEPRIGDICCDKCCDCGANAYCSDGTCHCYEGYHNCDGDWSNGCECNYLNTLRVYERIVTEIGQMVANARRACGVKIASVFQKPAH